MNKSVEKLKECEFYYQNKLKHNIQKLEKDKEERSSQIENRITTGESKCRDILIRKNNDWMLNSHQKRLRKQDQLENYSRERQLLKREKFRKTSKLMEKAKVLEKRQFIISKQNTPKNLLEKLLNEYIW